MCGIIGIINKNEKTAKDFIIDQFQDQSSRGTQGFGIIFVQSDGSYTIKRSCTEVKATIDLYGNDAPIIFMHHRWPTSSDNKLQQTHPISVSDGSMKHDYLFIHNGIIRNEDTLKERHEELGFCYTTFDKKENKFNDSESAAIEVTRFIEKQIPTMDIEGSMAFICLQINKKTKKIIKVFFGHNGKNPLNMTSSRTKMLLSSEGPGENIKDNVMYEIGLDLGKTKKHNMKFTEEPIEGIIETPTRNYGQSSIQPHGSHIHNWENQWDPGWESWNPDEQEEDIEKISSEMREEIDTLLDILAQEMEGITTVSQIDPIEYTVEINRIISKYTNKANKVHIMKVLAEEKKTDSEIKRI